jgi:hypothetical protein
VEVGVVLRRLEMVGVEGAEVVVVVVRRQNHSLEEVAVEVAGQTEDLSFQVEAGVQGQPDVPQGAEVAAALVGQSKRGVRVAREVALVPMGELRRGVKSVRVAREAAGQLAHGTAEVGHAEATEGWREKV